MKAAIYARVSTRDKDQNPETQLRIVRQEADRLGYEVYREYIDRASALDTKHREAWRALMHDAQERHFQVVLVYRLDRAFRSVIHLHLTLQEWSSYGISFKSYSDPIDTTTASGRFSLSILGAVAEFERELIAERVRAGMDRVREQGTKSGKPIGHPRADVDAEQVLNAYQQTSCIRAAARIAGCSSGTAWRILDSAGVLGVRKPHESTAIADSNHAA